MNKIKSLLIMGGMLVPALLFAEMTAKTYNTQYTDFTNSGYDSDLSYGQQNVVWASCYKNVSSPLCSCLISNYMLIKQNEDGGISINTAWNMCSGNNSVAQ